VSILSTYSSDMSIFPDYFDLIAQCVDRIDEFAACVDLTGHIRRIRKTRRSNRQQDRTRRRAARLPRVSEP